MQFKKTIRITPHPQPLSHASGERGEKTLLLAPLPEFGEGPGVGSVLRLHKLNCIMASPASIATAARFAELTARRDPTLLLCVLRVLCG